MSKFAHRSAVAAGLVALSLASTASWAASTKLEFKTFFDPTTAVTTDTKTLGYAVATLEMKDISGGVEFTLAQNKNAFPEKLGGTFLESLYLKGPSGTISNTLFDKISGASHNRTGFTKDGYSMNWDIDFLFLGEGDSVKFTIKGTGLDIGDFGSNIILDVGNVGKPYATGFLGLNDNVHFIGTQAIPEPGTYALMGLGLVGLTLAVRRRRQA